MIGWRPEREQITEGVDKDLSVVKIANLLARRGVLVPYRTLHRFCIERCGFGRGGRSLQDSDDCGLTPRPRATSAR